MKVQASLSVSAILSRTIMTDSRRRHRAEVDSRSSCTRLFFVVMIPMLCSLQLHTAHSLTNASDINTYSESPQCTACAVNSGIWCPKTRCEAAHIFKP
jgi:hypothetical protein